MRQWNKPYCRICLRPVSECGSVSWRGKCSACAKARTDANTDALHFHSGPEFKEWRRQVAASVGAVLVDDIMDAL